MAQARPDEARRLLEDAGFHVSAAADAEEALSLLAEESFDCVVTDIEMPRMDGFDLVRNIRNDARWRQQERVRPRPGRPALHELPRAARPGLTPPRTRAPASPRPT